VGACAGPESDCNDVEGAGQSEESEVYCFASEWRWCGWRLVVLVWWVLKGLEETRGA
jgi:hypothetical protein